MVRLLYVLVVVIQFTFAFHAMKTGRGNKWLFIIFMAPVLGCILYYFLEVFPDSREERALRRRVRDIAKALNPDAELKRRAEDAEVNASVDNRAALADECLAKGMFDEAIRLYEGCREGPYRDDPRLAFSLARAHFYNQQWAQARELLSGLASAHPKFQPHEVRLLRARVLAATNRNDEALREYEALRDHYVGFEARYRHAMLLKQVGRVHDAISLFGEILKQAKRSTLESEQEWIKLARRERDALVTPA
jgi:hypothetical protein